MIRRTATLTLMFLLTAAAAFAQVKLEHKLPEGRTFTAESIVVVEQTLNATETNAETITTTETAIGERDAKGNVSVVTKVKSLQITAGGAVGDYLFDSVNPDDKGSSELEVMRDIHKALANRTVTSVFDKDNRVVEIKLDKDALSDVPEQLKGLVKSEVDPEYLKDAANQELDVLPAKAVNKGDSWERTTKADLGARQMLESKTKYTYEGTVEKDGRTLDKISSKTFSVELSIADDSPLPIRVKESKLEVKESAGVILFDRKLGRAVESKESTRIVGGITFEANGQERPAELDLTIRNEVALKI